MDTTGPNEKTCPGLIREVSILRERFLLCKISVINVVVFNQTFDLLSATGKGQEVTDWVLLFMESFVQQ